MRFSLLLLLLTVAPGVQQATVPPAPASITFTYEREGMPVPQYRLTIHEDGTGLYEAQVQSRTQSSEREKVADPITVSAPVRARLFAAAHAANRFNTRCASKAKNIASTGAKTLTYTGPDGTGTCSFDYTENKQVDQITNTFYGIATTLDLGRKLDFDHRFDRLGLDADIEILANAFKDDRATDPGLIATLLRSLVDDPQLIQRVRVKAASLLEQATAH